MSDKFQDKYPIPSFRLESWNYGNNAAYFITICTQNREHFFGEIIDRKMEMNSIGQTVLNEWTKTLTIRPDMNLELGEFVVMPNHFHAIIIIGKNKYNSPQFFIPRRDAMHCVSTGNEKFNNCIYYKNKFGPQSKNLASIIRGFKSAVTMYAHQNGHPNFAWQPRFHDHIIRNKQSFERIQNYIVNNPQNWKEDRFNDKM